MRRPSEPGDEPEANDGGTGRLALQAPALVHAKKVRAPFTPEGRAPRGVSNEKQSKRDVLANRPAKGAYDRRSRARSRRGGGDPAAPVHDQERCPRSEKGHRER